MNDIRQVILLFGCGMPIALSFVALGILAVVMLAAEIAIAWFRKGQQ